MAKEKRNSWSFQVTLKLKKGNEIPENEAKRFVRDCVNNRLAIADYSPEELRAPGCKAIVKTIENSNE